MPVQSCQIGGKPGWKWGKSGKCYTGVGARARAAKQGSAIRASGFVGNRTTIVPGNPLKADPTRTTTLRRMFETEIRRRLIIIARKVRQLVEVEDAFGLKTRTGEFTVSNKEQGDDLFNAGSVGEAGGVGEEGRPTNGDECCDIGKEEVRSIGNSRKPINGDRRDEEKNNREDVGAGSAAGEVYTPREIVGNTRWAFQTDPQKVESFRKWIGTQVEADILVAQTSLEDAYWTSFVEEAYKKGAGRAFDDVRKPALWSGKEGEFFRGTREEFLRQSFGRPVAIQKVKLLAGRVFTSLEGISSTISTKMTQALAQGLAMGQNPRGIARTMIKEGIGFTKRRGIQSRALTIARTETIRAHAEGQLDALESLGVTEVGVMVEWSTAGDDRVCQLCQPLESTVLKIKEARGILPRHPNCRCSFIPANVGESKKGQIRGKAKVQKARNDSIRAEMPKRSRRTLAEQKDRSPWPGADKRIVKVRPKSVLDAPKVKVKEEAPTRVKPDLLLPTNTPGKKLPSGRVAEIMDQNTDAALDIQAIKRDLAKESEFFVSAEVSIADLKGLDDIDVIAGRANLRKGEIIVGRDGTIYDGRHRAALARSRGQEKIKAWVPIEKPPLRLTRKIGPGVVKSLPREITEQFTKAERLEFGRLAKIRTSLNKKIKLGAATNVEVLEVEQVRKRLAELKAIAKKRAKGGGVKPKPKPKPKPPKPGPKPRTKPEPAGIAVKPKPKPFVPDTKSIDMLDKGASARAKDVQYVFKEDEPLKIYHVTTKDAAKKIRKEGFKGSAKNIFQGFESEVQGTYGWADLDRARFEVARMADAIADTAKGVAKAADDFVIIEIEVPKIRFKDLRPDEDFSLLKKDWKKSLEEMKSVAVQGDLPASSIRTIYTHTKLPSPKGYLTGQAVADEATLIVDKGVARGIKERATRRGLNTAHGKAKARYNDLVRDMVDKKAYVAAKVDLHVVLRGSAWDHPEVVAARNKMKTLAAVKDPIATKAAKQELQKHGKALGNFEAGIRKLNKVDELAMKKLVRLNPDARSKVKISYKGAQKTVKDGVKAFEDVVTKEVLDNTTLVVNDIKGRSHYNAFGASVDTAANKKTMIHEMGHWLEGRKRKNTKAAQDFLHRRTKGAEQIHLGENYGLTEFYKPRTDGGKWTSNYIGKVYSYGSTEVVSMGLAEYATNPLKLAKDDKGLFDFIASIVRGDFL
ncbi:hypothetical protein LCGC14_0429130 [marine sediment metagenome]|uniref:Phage head morphogenesis domain-containing protein n=1 Tax=marine sediment metagenome TaxID=412755 RepID=A0A0F9SNN7_9ZZZZ